ncbi:MAG: hypothetical protein ACLFSV_01775 [Alkalispirochaeta sp.]
MRTPPFLCLDIPDLEIQLLRRRYGIPSGRPLLVVESDRPGARVRSCNTAAAALGISPGMRYAEALSRSREVQAGTVSAAELREVVGELRALLGAFLPDVEKWSLVDSVFWGDARGMEHLGFGRESWFRRLAEDVGAAGWVGGTAAGWTRPGTFLAARQAGLEATAAAEDLPGTVLEGRVSGSKGRVSGREGKVSGSEGRVSGPERRVSGSECRVSGPGMYTFPALRVVTFPDREREVRWYRSRRISYLPLDGRDLERLALLGVTRVGEFIDLPEDRLLPRFGERLREIHRFVRGEMDGVPPRDEAGTTGEIREQMRYEPPLLSATPLCAAAIQLLEQALPAIRERGEWIKAVRFTFIDDNNRSHPETIECGGVTRDVASIGRLLAIRLERRAWRAREIEEIEVVPCTEIPSVIQGTFASFETGDAAGTGNAAGTGDAGTEHVAGGEDGSGIRRRTPVRPGENERKALAILQARVGTAGVFRIELQPGRAPEQRFTRIEISSDRYRTGGSRTHSTGTGAQSPRVRIRRILIDGAVPHGSNRHREVRPYREAHSNSGAHPDPGALPPVRYGPFVYAGEWWNGDEADRIYSYRGYPGGTLLWGYRTVSDARWIVQGWLA